MASPKLNIISLSSYITTFLLTGIGFNQLAKHVLVSHFYWHRFWKLFMGSSEFLSLYKWISLYVLNWFVKLIDFYWETCHHRVKLDKLSYLITDCLHLQIAKSGSPLFSVMLATVWVIIFEEAANTWKEIRLETVQKKETWNKSLFLSNFASRY